jgi:Tfp pilus assembly protein PilF
MRGQLEDAREATDGARRAIAKDWLLLAAARAHAGQLAEALAAAERALECSPGSPEALHTLAQLLKVERQEARAQELISRAARWRTIRSCS